MMRLKVQSVLIIVVAISSGCSDKARPSAATGADSGKPAKEGVPPVKPNAPVTESEAKAKLTAVLKSWSFGDTAEQFEKVNPGLQIFEPTWSIGQISGIKLVRYDIRNGRASTEKLAPAAVGVIEFLVALDFQNRPEGPSITRTYKVQKNKDGSWVVSADRD